MSLYTGLEEVKVGNRKSLLNALKSLSDFDCDFNGENGLEYLWEEVDGFESNMDYLADKVKDIEDDEDCVETFFKEWMSRDINYYKEWNVSVLTDTKKRVKAISFSTVCGY
ncbi:MAG TPA: hypothetical protein DCW90_17995 [Lachnospiraceae bacterium]|nr:hypothetical protein [Lachnospiraceae bacterium]